MSLETYSAVTVEAGRVRRLWFEAPDAQAAQAFCVRIGAGFQGPAARPADTAPAPEAYDKKTACKMLGGLSESTLYRLLATGKLERLPGTWRVLVTRSSLERYCRGSR